MYKRAVVFGATGVVGSELLNQLLISDKFEKVTIVVRRLLKREDTKLEQIELADFSTMDSLGCQLDADAYFCCVGTTIKKAGSQGNFHKVDLEIPKLIARLAEKLSIPTLVVVSAIGADRTSSNFYLNTKGEMENSVKRLYSGSLHIIRPSLLMDKRSDFRLGERISILLMKVLGVFFIGTLKKYKGVYAREVAASMIDLIH